MMTKRIREFKRGDITYFEFVNLNHYEDCSLLSYFLVNDIGAEFVDAFKGIWSISRIFKKDSLEFDLVIHGDYEGPCLLLLGKHKNEYNELRLIAYELLSIIRAKSKYFTSWKKRQRLLTEFRFSIEELKNRTKNREKYRPNSFKVNEYITLKLENKKTVIYVAGKRFNQCKTLLLNIPKNKINDFDEIGSIDEAEEKLDYSLEEAEYNHLDVQIPPEVEFWGHCSNLQVWAENNYDTCLLHRNLAFPLLEKLTKKGDPQAKRVFKEEIAKRFQSKYLPVVQYLKEAGDYMYYLNEEEKEVAFSDYDKVIVNGKPITVIGIELDLSYNKINDITEIKGLEKCTYLKELDLSYNDIKEIKCLENLTNLTVLWLSSNNIKEIKGLENLTNLTELSLSDNNIKKIEGLETLKKLKRLNLIENNIEKIEGLYTLINLHNLDISKNGLKKIEGLDNLINLKSLYLHDNKITKIEGLENLTSIQKLFLRGNSIKKLENLDSLTNLEELTLSYNKIIKIEGLDSLISLNFLSLTHNQVSKIEGLEMTKRLEWLKLESNNIQKIENLDSLTNLQKLSLYGNQITKIEGLNELKNLNSLDIENNPISELEGLGNLENLEVLFIDDTQIPIKISEKFGIEKFGVINKNKIKRITDYYKQLKNK